MSFWKKLLLNLCVIGLLVIHFMPTSRESLRREANHNLVKITNEAGNSGGTGFHVVTPSGKVYILTNAHICGLKDKNNNVFIADEEGSRTIPRKVIEESGFTDLCLVEGLHKSGFSVANNYEIGKLYHLIGHPKLRPASMVDGEFSGVGIIEVLDHIIQGDGTPGECSLPKNKKQDYYFFGLFKVQLCLIQIEANYSTFFIVPGNSGSPVFNDKAELVSVAFAGDEDNVGYFITLGDIKEFLQPY